MQKQQQSALHGSAAAATKPKIRVAIIGSGLAGLATAHLLQKDDQERFDISLFEQGESLSLDAASVTVKNAATGVTERVNIPSRSVNRGYYQNLTRMYDYLRIPMRHVRYTFIFAEVQSKEAKEVNTSLIQQQNTDAMAGAYLVFENLYKYLSSPRFNGNWVQQLWQMIFLTASYIWFMVSCLLFEPRTATTAAASTKTSTTGSESLHSYLRRMRVPRQFVDQHLLPVLGAICTCSHEELSNFPASDIVNFMKRSALQRTYLTDGVYEMQSRLLHGINDVRLQTRVSKVDKVDGGVLVKSELLQDGTITEEVFDRVVLAMAPNIVARIFKPASRALGSIPTAPTTASIIDPSSTKQISVEEWGKAPCGKLFSQNDDAQIMTFRTAFAGAEVQTEAWHYLPSGAISTTSALPHSSDVGRILHAAQFTRTLRTVESRMAVQRVLREAKPVGDGSKTSDECWVSGQDNVWVAGSWCWDGMVLLEGCVVSAMRVADDFGVKIPW